MGSSETFGQTVLPKLLITDLKKIHTHTQYYVLLRFLQYAI